MTATVLLTVRDFVNATGISRSKVYELMNSGELESIHIGRSRRIPTEAVEAFVAKRRAEASALDPAH